MYYIIMSNILVAACPLLDPPPNCDIEYTIGSSSELIARYTCDPGFVIGSGNSERTCRTIGTWSGIAASCVGEDIITKCKPSACIHA